MPLPKSFGKHRLKNVSDQDTACYSPFVLVLVFFFVPFVLVMIPAVTVPGLNSALAALPKKKTNRGNDEKTVGLDTANSHSLPPCDNFAVIAW